MTSFPVIIRKTQNQQIIVDSCTCAFIEIKCQTANTLQATSVNTRDLTFFFIATEHIKLIVPFEGTRIIRLSVTGESEVKLRIIARWIDRIGAFATVSVDCQ